ncbi:MAG TPA: hypothetical protein VND65_15275 [Candidatus Binatia bacterium]|nr:hypothetical protein [Candidatus Binatia bacterium]
MSSAVISTTAAQGRFFVFEDETVVDEAAASAAPGWFSGRTTDMAAGGYRPQSANEKSKLLSAITPASRLELRPAPEMVPSGISAIDALTGGLPRGCLTEICGPASSGRATFLSAALAATTQRGEFCAVVDASDALDPQSLVNAGVNLGRLLWVRCGDHFPVKKASPQRHPSTAFRAGRDAEKRKQGHPERNRASGGADLPANDSRFSSEHCLEQLLRATDLLLESGGFGLIALDLCDLPPQTARRIPLTTWFRFRRAVEHTPTVLLALERQSIAGSCSSLLLKSVLGSRFSALSEERMQLLTGMEIKVEVVRSRLNMNWETTFIDRKPPGSASAAFSCKTAWTG